VLDRFAASVQGRGRVYDLGCGPGQVARYLAGRGVAAFGIDASASMIATARRLNPKLNFRQGDFFALPLAEGALAGVPAFYCLIHCARTELGRAVAEIHRVLMPGGRLLMAVHAGEGEVARDDLLLAVAACEQELGARTPLNSARRTRRHGTADRPC
jgi:SAM-dependent methyltransferase